ncbi:hypothetical protein C3L33_19988, partial [Rhododendron williamsianum]
MEFSCLTRLVKLDLSNSWDLRIENPNLFTLFRNLSRLTELYLDFVNISANGYEWGQVISSSLPNLRVLSLRSCYLSGPIDSSLQNLQYLSEIDLSANNFSSPVPDFFANFANLTVLILSDSEFYGTFPNIIFQRVQTLETLEFHEVSGFLPNGSLSTLDTLDLSHNKLQGPIPSYFFDFQSLVTLDLSSNNFSGTIQLESKHRLQNLTHLDFSYNSLSVNASISNSSLSSFPQLNTLGLASCNLQKFPPLMNQSQLFYLDLSDNHISGVIPNWIWNLARGFQSNQFVGYLNLSCNFLVGLQSEYLIPTSLFDVIDLHSNQLHGEIPIPPESAFYVDYSRNNFSSSLSADIGNAIASAEFFFISDNMLSGPIPPSICNGSNRDINDSLALYPNV